MSYLFVSYIYTQFKVWRKVFGGQILFTGSLLLGYPETTHSLLLLIFYGYTKRIHSEVTINTKHQ